LGKIRGGTMERGKSKKCNVEDGGKLRSELERPERIKSPRAIYERVGLQRKQVEVTLRVGRGGKNCHDTFESTEGKNSPQADAVTRK